MNWDELQEAIFDDPEALDKQLKRDEGLVIREWVHHDVPRVMIDRLGLRCFPGFVELRRWMSQTDETRKVIAVGVETVGKDHQIEWIAKYKGPIFDHGQLLAEI